MRLSQGSPRHWKNEEIPDDGQLARYIFHDPHFSGDRVGELRIFRFEGGESADGSKKESCGWRKYAPSDADVHNLGSKVAADTNERKRSDALKAQKPTPAKRYYCGYYPAEAGRFRIDDPSFKVTVEHDIENGNRAHVTVRLTYGDGLDRNGRANVRTKAGRALAKALGAPTPFVPIVDQNDMMHPINRWGVGCLEMQ